MKWERVTIFISSTFNDMHAERDYLVKDVFPELREWCEERKIHLVDVDLRWGVREEDSKSKNTVLACLNNIDESRPFFLCFLGQRRGWVPTKGDISKETKDEYPDICENVGNKSVTEMEIEHALLSPMKHIVDGTEELKIPVNHALFYFRKDDYLKSLTKAQEGTYTNKSEKNPDLVDKKLKIFKEKIINGWTYITPYDCKWDPTILSPELPEDINQGRLTDFNVEGEPLREVIIKQLKAEISKEFPNREKVEYSSDLERDLDQQVLFIELNSEGFIPRDGDFDDLNGYLSNDKNGLFVLTAPAGYGKSMLLANFIKRESEKYTGRFFNRFCGASDLASEQYSLWKTIFEEANIECPDTLKDIKDNIEELLEEIAKEKTTIIIDAINQLPDGLDMLEWLPKELPENFKIILSMKEDKDDEKIVNAIENLKKNENISYSTVKPFKDCEEKKKLIKEYLKKYLKALDDEQIYTICGFKGSDNPLYLKILLSELRVFGAFDQLSDEIKQFGDTQKEAFNTVLDRLENDINSLNIDSKEFVPLLFGLLANARNGLSEKELKSCIQEELTNIEDEKIIQAIRLFIRQVRPFMARREGRTDYFYESFKLAAKYKYINGKIHYNKILSEFFKKQVDPENDLSFKGENIRDFNEFPFHLYKSQNTKLLEKILGEFIWIKNKMELSDIDNVIIDYHEYIHQYRLHYLKLIEETLTLSAHILRKDKKQLPSQLWGRMVDIDNENIKSLCEKASDLTDYTWLKPFHQCMVEPGNQLGILKGDSEGNVVNKVCFSPDGKLIATGNRTKNCILHDSKSFRKVNAFKHNGATYGVAFSPDGTLIATGSSDGTCILWNVNSGEKINTLKGHTHIVFDIAFSPDGKLLATASWDKTCIIWDANTGEKINTFKDHSNNLYGVNFSTDGRLLATVSNDNTCILYDTENYNKINTLIHDTALFDLSFSPDGTLLATPSYDESCILWDTKTGKKVKILDLSYPVTNVCFSPDGDILVLGFGEVPDIYYIAIDPDEISQNFVNCLDREDITIDDMINVLKKLENREMIGGCVLWDLKSDKMISTLHAHSSSVLDSSFSPDGNMLATASFDGNGIIWDTSYFMEETRFIGHDDRVYDTCFSPNGNLVASASWDKTCILWDMKSGEKIKTLKGHKSVISSATFSSDGKLLATGSWDKTCIIWNIETGEKISTLNGHTLAIHDISFSPDGKLLATVSRDGFCIVWDLYSFESIITLKKHDDWIRGVNFSPDGKTLATVSSDGFSFLWDVKSGNLIRKLSGHKQYVTSVSFSPDGKLLATTSWDKTCILWDVNNGTQVTLLKKHNDWVNDVCFSPDGKLLATVSNDGTCILWDLNSYNEVAKFEADDSFHSVDFSSNGLNLTLGGDSGRVYFLSLENFLNGIPISYAFFESENVFINCNFCNKNSKISIEDLGNTTKCSFCGNNIQANSSPIDSITLSYESSPKIKLIDSQLKHVAPIHDLCFSNEGNLLATVSLDKTCVLWDTNSHDQICRLKHTNELASVSFSPDGSLLATAPINGNCLLWDTKNAKITKILDSSFIPVSSISFSPDGSLLATGLTNGKCILYDTQSYIPLKIFERHYDRLNAICFSPNGNIMATSSRDRNCILWDVKTGEKIISLAHFGPVFDGCFSPDGTIIATTSFGDYNCTLWDAKTGAKLNIIDYYKKGIYKVRFSSNGEFIITSGDENCILWDVKTGKKISEFETTNAFFALDITSKGQIAIGDFMGIIIFLNLEINSKKVTFLKPNSIENNVHIKKEKRLF